MHTCTLMPMLAVVSADAAVGAQASRTNTGSRRAMIPDQSTRGQGGRRSVRPARRCLIQGTDSGQIGVGHAVEHVVHIAAGAAAYRRRGTLLHDASPLARRAVEFADVPLVLVERGDEDVNLLGPEFPGAAVPGDPVHLLHDSRDARSGPPGPKSLQSSPSMARSTSTTSPSWVMASSAGARESGLSFLRKLRVSARHGARGCRALPARREDMVVDHDYRCPTRAARRRSCWTRSKTSWPRRWRKCATRT